MNSAEGRMKRVRAPVSSTFHNGERLPFSVQDNGVLHVEAWHPAILDLTRDLEWSSVRVHEKHWEHLDDLVTLRDRITHLAINDFPPRLNLSAISELHRLETLHLSSPGVAQIDFGRLPNLREIHIHDESAKLGNISEASALTKIDAVGCTFPDLTVFADVPNLRSLSVFESKLKTLNGVEHLQWLEDIALQQLPMKRLDGLHHARRLKSVWMYLVPVESVATLTQLADLTKLGIKVGKSITDAERIGELTGLRDLELYGALPSGGGWLSRLRNLERLWIEYDGKLPSLQFLEHMQCLKSLTLLGNGIADKNVSVLLRLQALTSVGFAHRPGYVPSADEVEAAFQARRVQRTAVLEEALEIDVAGSLEAPIRFMNDVRAAVVEIRGPVTDDPHGIPTFAGMVQLLHAFWAEATRDGIAAWTRQHAGTADVKMIEECCRLIGARQSVAALQDGRGDGMERDGRDARNAIRAEIPVALHAHLRACRGELLGEMWYALGKR